MSDVIYLALRQLRLPLIVLILVYGVAIAGLSLIPGQDDHGNATQLSFFHAFYFVSFMSTTIGFGEIPHPFTDQQRLWVLVCIYTSVIAWLYAIGTLFRLVQDPTFQRALAASVLRRSISRTARPFYLICGYGDTGQLLAKGLAELNLQAVIIDREQAPLSSIKLTELSPRPITVVGNTTLPSVLQSAGVDHPKCLGVIAVTGDDHVNLNVAVAVKLLNPSLKVICRSEIKTEGDNIRSFGDNTIIDPFESFTLRLQQLISAHEQYTLHSWLVDQHSKEQINLEIARKGLPKGLWIVCGYGRLGKSISKMLHNQGVEVQIVDNQHTHNHPPEGTISGRGTEAATLLEAGIKEASVIVAATNDDANNLSILLTAKQVNTQIYSIGRINRESKYLLYQKVHCDYLMRRSQLIANKALTLISRPLVNSFLNETRLTPKVDEPETRYRLGERAGQNASATDFKALVNSINLITDNQAPKTYRLSLTQIESPGLMSTLSRMGSLPIKDLLGCADDQPLDIPLFLARGKGNHRKFELDQNEKTLCPSLDTRLYFGDQLLLCHNSSRTSLAKRLAQNSELSDSVLGHNTHYIPLLRWLKRLRNKIPKR